MICLFWLSCSLIYLYQLTLDNYATDFYTSHYIIGQFTSPGSISSYWYCSKREKLASNKSHGTSLFLHSAGQEKCQSLKQDQPHQVSSVIHLTSHHLHSFLPMFLTLLVRLFLLRFSDAGGYIRQI